MPIAKVKDLTNTDNPYCRKIIRLARISHFCSNCGNTIYSREKYLEVTFDNGIFTNDFNTMRYCNNCAL